MPFELYSFSLSFQCICNIFTVNLMTVSYVFKRIYKLNHNKCVVFFSSVKWLQFKLTKIWNQNTSIAEGKKSETSWHARNHAQFSVQFISFFLKYMQRNKKAIAHMGIKTKNSECDAATLIRTVVRIAELVCMHVCSLKDTRFHAYNKKEKYICIFMEKNRIVPISCVKKYRAHIPLRSHFLLLRNFHHNDVEPK